MQARDAVAVRTPRLAADTPERDTKGGGEGEDAVAAREFRPSWIAHGNITIHSRYGAWGLQVPRPDYVQAMEFLQGNR
jgi:hypothetical protein